MKDKHIQPTARDTFVELVQKMGEEDLRICNQLIIDRLKLLAQARSTAMLCRFHVGDRVGFMSSSGVYKTGVIMRLNKKTATLVTDEQEQWNVSPHFLEPIRSAHEQRS